jgi:Flp pilus assembly protein TadB
MVLALLRYRSAEDVVIDLAMEDGEVAETSVNHYGSHEKSSVDAYAAIGFMLLLFFLGFVIGRLAVAAALFIGSIAILVRATIISRAKNSPNQEVERALPLFVEQLVMFAQAGKDIPACIEGVIDTETADLLYPMALTDMFKVIMQRANAGTSFSESLRQAATESSSPLVKHVLLYLGGAYKEGTEVSSMLQELSEATQQLVEDRVEERIARLPALATAPLIISFSGLLIIYLSIPLLRILGQLKEHAL